MTTAPPVPPRAEGAATSGRRAAPTPDARAGGPQSHRLRYVVVGAVLVGAFAFLVVKGLGSALDFYLPADQAVHQEASLGGKTFNLEGVVRPGSVRSTPNGVDFEVSAGATTVQVDNSGSPPELFAPDIPVIAVGHFSSGVFVSDQILVKHSATYIAAHPGRVTAPNGTKQ
jgi:cytochrome c-type biogenesis protein CcmE